ncbi:MAG: alcohol dehydrogenase catalytic domain-containing protein [Caldilineaceae bacterium]|nr:alcohol dehydrogenase catalytic domain-containing protein [Caldilineaceae bacterium]
MRPVEDMPTMRQAVCPRTGAVEVIRVPRPNLAPGDLLAELRLCGICGTDLMKVYDPDVPKPVQLGHEIVALVVEVGAEADAAWLGRRVVVGHHVPDYGSHYTRRGSAPMDAAFKRTNIEPGGFADFIRIPADHVRHTVQPLPDDLPDRRAVFTEPLACCLRALDRVTVTEGDTTLLAGAGAVGMLFIPLLQARSSRVIATDVRARALTMAAAWGARSVSAAEAEGVKEAVRAASDGRGADLVILTVVTPAILDLAMESVRDGGTLLLFGVKPGTRIKTDYWAIWRRELNVISSYSATPDLFPRALAVLGSASAPLEELITHVCPLTDADDAFRLAQAGQAMKVVISRA